MRKQAAVNRDFMVGVIKGVGASVFISAVLILLFALLIKQFVLPDWLINPVNQGIKVVSILAGVFLAVRGGGEKGFAKGLAIGLIYTIVGIASAILLGGTPPEPFAALAETALGALAGAVCGILSVNIIPGAHK